MAQKDQIQQIANQIERRINKIGKVKPRYARQIQPSTDIVVSEPTSDNIYWSKLWFNNHHDNNEIGPGVFASWVEEHTDMSFGIVGDIDGNIHDGPVGQYDNIYYALEVLSETNKTVEIKIDTTCYINVLVDNESLFSGRGEAGSTVFGVIRGGRTWVPIEIYVYNTYGNDSQLNTINFELNLRSVADEIRVMLPSPPGNFVATDGTHTDQITLTWDLNPNITNQDQVQIWYKISEDAEWEILASVNGNLTSYSHVNLSMGSQYRYKARFITREGGVSQFTPSVIGRAGSVSTSLNINFSPNLWVGDQDTIGYYQSDEIVTVTITSDVELFERALSLDLEYPTASGIHYNRTTLGIVSGDREWITTINLADIDTEDYPLGEGRAKLIVHGYIPGVAGEQWAGPLGTAGELIKVKGFTIDDTVPQVDFFIDYDRQIEEEDPITYSDNVALIIRSMSDPNLNTQMYHNEEGEEYEHPYEDGGRYVGGTYQIRWANDELTLTGVDSNNVPNTPWISVALQGPIIDPHFLCVTGEDSTKYVYMQSMDKCGNASQIEYDTIVYRSGILSVTGLSAQGGYNGVNLEWDPLIDPATGQYVLYLDGYLLYRNLTGVVPEPGADYSYEIAGATNTGYLDTNIDPSTTYYYWAKGFSGPIENRLVSTGYSDRVEASIDVSAPQFNDGFLATGYRDHIKFKWNVPDESNLDRSPTRHTVYRYQGSSPPPDGDLLLADMIFVMLITGSNMELEYNDFGISALAWDSDYIYTAVPANGPYFGQYYETRTGYDIGGNWSIPTGLTDSPPGAPVFNTEQTYGAHWGLRLAWDPNLEHYEGDNDIVSYTLYAVTGDQPGYSPGSGESFASFAVLPSSLDMNYFFHLRTEMDEQFYTYWLKAADERGQSSEFSAAFVTGYLNVYPDAPYWDSGNCYAGFGMNHLEFIGNGDQYNCLEGYNVYGVRYDPETTYESDASLETVTGDAGYDAELLYFVEDHRSDPGYRNVYEHILSNAEFGNERYYWLTSINSYENESAPVLLTGLGPCLPNYDTLFQNYLDNSSFERALDQSLGTWVLGANTSIASEINGYVGQKYVKTFERLTSVAPDALKYEYVFAQPSKDYTFSYYIRTEAGTDNSLNVMASGRIIWYSGSDPVNTGYYNNSLSGISTTWERKYHHFESPADTTRAELYFGVFDSSPAQYKLVDCFQWEVSGEGTPTQYTDSRVMAADRIMAHIIVGDMIKFGSIEGDHIAAETISGGNIMAGTITLDKLETIPQLPTMTFDFDPTTAWAVGNHGIEIVSAGDIRLYYGESEYTVEWKDTLLDPAWERNTEYRVSGPNSDDTYYIHGDYDHVSEHVDLGISGLFPIGDFSDVILARIDCHSDINGGVPSIIPFAGPGVMIEGSNIVAGYVSADRIEVGSLDGDKITAHTITVDEIQVGLIPVLAESKFKFNTATSIKLILQDLAGGSDPEIQFVSGTPRDLRFSEDDIPNGWIYISSIELRGPAGSLQYDGYHTIYGLSTGAGIVYIKLTALNALPAEGEYDFILGRLYVPDHIDYKEETHYTIEPAAGGGVIINGDGIVADTIRGTHISADEILATHIHSLSIESRHIQTNTILTRHLQIGGNNLVKNGDFRAWSNHECVQGIPFDIDDKKMMVQPGPYLWAVSYIGGPYFYWTDDSYIGSNAIKLYGNFTPYNVWFCIYSCMGLAAYDHGINPNYFLDDIDYRFSMEGTVDDVFCISFKVKILAVNSVPIAAKFRIYYGEIGSTNNLYTESVQTIYYYEDGTIASVGSCDIRDTWLTAAVTVGPDNSDARFRNSIFSPGGGGADIYRIIVYLSNHTVTVNNAVVVDGFSITRGLMPPMGWMGDQSTVIEGNRIRTGTINAENVLIKSASSQIQLDEVGVTVGDVEDAYTRVSDRGLYYVDKNNYVTYYDYKTRMLTNVASVDIGIWQIPIDLYEFESAPQVTATPVSFMPIPKIGGGWPPIAGTGDQIDYVGKAGSVFVPEYKSLTNQLFLHHVIGNVLDGAGGIPNNEPYGMFIDNYELREDGFTGTVPKLSTDMYLNGSPGFENYDHIYDTSSPYYRNWDNEAITYTANRLRHSCAFRVDMELEVEGPCQNLEVCWGVATINEDTWATIAYYIGKKIFTLKNGEIIKYQIPSMTLKTFVPDDHMFNSEWVFYCHTACGGPHLQVRCWTYDASYNPQNTPITLTIKIEEYQSAVIRQTDKGTVTGSPVWWTSDEYWLTHFLANVTIREV